MSREPRDPFVDDLLDAAKVERPREGAKGRALTSVLPELRAAVATPAAVPRARDPLVSVVITAATTLLVAASFGGLFFKHQSDVAASALAAQAAELAAQQAQTKRLMDELKAQSESVASLQGAVANAKDDAARAAALAQLDEAREKAAQTKTRLTSASAGAARTGAAPARARAKCDCTPGDPLCSCIP